MTSFSSFAESLSLKERLNRDLLYNLAGLSILALSGMVLNTLILAFQGASALGVFNQVFAFYLILSQLAVGGLQFSTLKHISHSQDNLPQCALITTSALALVSCFGIFVCLALYAVHQTIGQVLGSQAVGQGLIFVIPGLYFFTINKVQLAVLNGLRHMRAFAAFQALRAMLILAGAGALMLSGYSGAHLPLALSMAEILLFLILVLYLNLGLFRFRFPFSSSLGAWYQRHLSFGARGFLSGVLIEMNTRVDVLMLGFFLSDSLVGVYSFAATFAEGFAQLTTIIRQNIDPLIGRAFAEGRKEQIEQLAQRVRRSYVPVLGLLGVLACGCFPLLVWLASPGQEHWQSLAVFAILVSGIVLASAYRPFATLLIQGGRPGSYTILVAGSVGANLALNAGLIPLLGMYGAALATALVFVLEALAVIVLARRLFAVRL